jgi:hypothetical protein
MTENQNNTDNPNLDTPIEQTVSLEPSRKPVSKVRCLLESVLLTAVLGVAHYAGPIPSSQSDAPPLKSSIFCRWKPARGKQNTNQQLA